MNRRSARGQATVDWLLATALVALLAFGVATFLFSRTRALYRLVADCVARDECAQADGERRTR